MIWYHYIDNHLCKFLSINNDFNWLIIYYFGQEFNNDKNQVVAIVFPFNGQWQSCDKIY